MKKLLKEEKMKRIKENNLMRTLIEKNLYLIELVARKKNLEEKKLKNEN